MRLPLFFPTAFALIGAMIWWAIEPGFENQEQMAFVRATIAQQGYVIQGDALGDVIEGARVQTKVLGPPSLRRAVMSSQATPDEGTSSQGVLFVAPPFALGAFSGRPIEVVLTVRSAHENGSEHALLRLDIQNSGSSGWREIEIGEDFSEVGFVYDVPESDRTDAMFVMIWPDAEGLGQEIEVRQVILRPLD